MILELTDLDRELERILGSNMPGHGDEETEAPAEADEEEADEEEEST